MNSPHVLPLTPLPSPDPRFSFPPVLGVQSYFLDVPEMTGLCSIAQNGNIVCECGHGCQVGCGHVDRLGSLFVLTPLPTAPQPLDHDLVLEGCEILSLMIPFQLPHTAPGP